MYLIGALFLSVVLPLLPFRYAVAVEPEGSQIVFQAINETMKTIQPVNAAGYDAASQDATALTGLTGILTVIYFTGAFIVLLRLFIQTGYLINLLYHSKIISIEGIRIVENRKFNSAFSFFNIVFINPDYFDRTDLRKIIAHERVHINEYHWFDLIISELLTVIFWFNPFMWFFERSIRQNHEYLADRGVLSLGYSAGQYQALLASQAIGIQVIGLTNNLNFSLNQNRFKMMTKKKTPGLRSLKLLVILPVVATIVFAFAEPTFVSQGENISSAGITGSQEKFILAGEVVDERGNPVHAVSVILKGTTTGTITGPDGKFELEIPPGNELVLSFVGKETIFHDLSDIRSATPVEGKYQKKYVMRDGVFIIDRDRHFLSPPPPPPPSALRERAGSPATPPAARDRAGRTEMEAADPDEEYVEVFIVVEEMPEYPGRFSSLGQYIKAMEEMHSREHSLKGDALAGFTVDENGKVTDIRILEADSDAISRSAVEIISGMDQWSPGRQRGKAVPVNFTLPLEFR